MIGELRRLVLKRAIVNSTVPNGAVVRVLRTSRINDENAMGNITVENLYVVADAFEAALSDSPVCFFAQPRERGWKSE